jgi:hypothetical protein
MRFIVMYHIVWFSLEGLIAFAAGHRCASVITVFRKVCNIWWRWQNLSHGKNLIKNFSYTSSIKCFLRLAAWVCCNLFIVHAATSSAIWIEQVAEILYIIGWSNLLQAGFASLKELKIISLGYLKSLCREALGTKSLIFPLRKVGCN